MIERLAFAGIMLLGSIVALPKVPVYLYDVVAQVPTPTPVPPVVIPAWILGGGKFYMCCYDVDPGALPDQHLFAGVLDASETTDDALKTNCPGIGASGNVSNCNPYKYINMLALLCDDTLDSESTYSYLNGGAHESAFLHLYASGSVSRINIGGSCTLPTPNSGYPTNPDDATFQGYLASTVWTTPETNFPTPYGIYEDHFAAFGGPCRISYEYGDEACNVQGTSASPNPYDWETALGSFEKNAEANCATTCFAFIGNGLTPGGGQDTGPCSNFEGSHCYVTSAGGVVDDMDALDNLCSAADSGGYLRGITAEEIVFLKGTPGPSPTPSNAPVYAKTQTVVYMINTMSHLVNYTGNCANLVAIDVESSGGSFPGLSGYGAGTIEAGIQIREEATALRFLVPNLKTLVPDRMQPFYFTIGGTRNAWTPTDNECTSTQPYCEVPYFFEETLVPQGPEIPVRGFTYAGKSSVGDGCPPSPVPSDYGGAADLKVDCVTTDTDTGAAVFLQEYKHLYINGADYGPVAVLLNTAGTTSVPISSTWFSCSGCSALTSFGYQLTLNGGELPSVVYGSGSISLPCTATPYCTANENTVPENTATFSPGSPGSIGPRSGIILIGSNTPR